MRKRDYKAEYRRRIERGLKKGLSRSQARGHPKPAEKPVSPRKKSARVRPDKSLDAAIREMNRGTSMTAAARAEHVSVERLRRFLVQESLADKEGTRWVPKDQRPRRVPVMTGGRFRILTVDGYQQARIVGEHHNAVGQFVRSNNLSVIEPFVGLHIRGANGNTYLLETDPNALHRIAAMDTPPFHEIYEIVSST